jgi:phosphotransferase system  glucose/maltose/N-acetylglucosamine-specific IIC component
MGKMQKNITFFAIIIAGFVVGILLFKFDHCRYNGAKLHDFYKIYSGASFLPFIMNFIKIVVDGVLT